MELWHTKTVEQTRDALQSTEQGLSAEQVRSATQKHGLNELRHKKPKSVGKLFLEQMTDVMILVLLAAAAISAFLGEVVCDIQFVSTHWERGVSGRLGRWRCHEL